MNVMEAIQTRRSVGKVQDRVPEKEKLEQVLEAARWAPNHHKTEPWHFFVLQGEGRSKLGEAYGRIQAEKLDNPTEEDIAKAMEIGQIKAERSPVVIVATVEPAEGEKIEPIEEVAAAACAVQNMLLVAHELGLGVKWRTGKSVFHPIMKETFGLSDKGAVIGLLYIGYPEEIPEAPSKKEIKDYTTWID